MRRSEPGSPRFSRCWTAVVGGGDDRRDICVLSTGRIGRSEATPASGLRSAWRTRADAVSRRGHQTTDVRDAPTPARAHRAVRLHPGAAAPRRLPVPASLTRAGKRSRLSLQSYAPGSYGVSFIDLRIGGRHRAPGHASTSSRAAYSGLLDPSSRASSARDRMVACLRQARTL
jgi:hypothetical protein